MSKTLAEIIKKLTNLVDKVVSESKDFGIEFGTFSPNKLKATPVKNIIVSPFMNLKLVHFTNKNEANLIITVMPLSFIEKGLPLSEKNFELLKALILNNLRTIRLSEEWIYSLKGSFIYFLQTLGINKFTSSKITLSSTFSNYWSLSDIKFQDFLASLSHLSKKWSAYSYSGDDQLKVVIERDEFDEKDIVLLRKEGINTIIGFKHDSQKSRIYHEHRMNYLFLPFIEYCNIALRKFSQVVQLETEKDVIFYPQELVGWFDIKELE